MSPAAGTRREVLVDAVTIASGFLLPQVVFHATWIFVTEQIITTQALTVSAPLVSSLNQAWLLVWGMSLALVGLAWF